ncbi:acid phosphatase type 7-like isoform X2 [Tubulanus polymorphus]|uniref:acid phosphatase type 7-like isoform X2 n=1 Tax=Tubulanus polymorphus TaxID=672921 RepID=UPI003DA59A74
MANVIAELRNVKLLLVLVVLPNYLYCQVIYVQPEQIHLSYGGNPTEMVVTWVTLNDTGTNGTLLEYGKQQLSTMVHGKSTAFRDGGSEHRILYMHRATMTTLTPGQKYFYHVGGETGWSNIFHFTAMKAGTQWSPRLAVYGDFGSKNAQSLARLQEETLKGHFDSILHIGDFAYNMATDNARVGDQFMRQVESIAGYVPYMTCVGNHEYAYNFSNYKNRFTMPGGDGQGLFYSFDMGPIHFLAFNTEVYYSHQSLGWESIIIQYKWLEEDLKKANLPENRAKHPWIIAYGHRPFYCTNVNKEHCMNVRVGVIDGPGGMNGFGLEDLFYKYGVDLIFTAHEHSYERLLPVYKMKPCNGSYKEPYKNPTGPVHIVTGSAGCQEMTTMFQGIPYPFSGYHSQDYGYTRMTIFNGTHLSLEQVSDDQQGKVIDQIMYIREKHGAGLYTCHW